MLVRIGSTLVIAAMAACVVAGISPGGSMSPALSAEVVVDSEPPPPQVEPVQLRPGYVFIPGRWMAHNGQWLWVAGRWEPERSGYVWSPGRWQRQPRGWLWVEGSWVVSGPTTIATTPVETAPLAGPPALVASSPPRDPVSNAAPNAVAMLALGEGYTCSLSVAGQIRCWGYNHYGALGVGSRDRTADGIVSGIDGQVRAIAAGGYQTCALTATGDVWCWGSNLEGQVGNGSVAPSEQPVVNPIRVAGIRGVRSLHLGDKTSCALTHDQRLLCWGANAHKQIDDSNSKQITTPTQVRGTGRVELVAVGNYHLCYVSSGRATCRGQLAPLARDVAALTNVTGISAGYGHSCAIHDGKVSCWGNAYHGVLGNGNPCHNSNDGGACTSQLRPPALVAGIDANPVEIAGLDYHTCVRFANGTVTCFGSNQGGSFSDSIPKEPWQTAHTLGGVVADAVYVGGVHVCTVRNGAASCRGNNWAGAVGGAR